MNLGLDIDISELKAELKSNERSVERNMELFARTVSQAIVKHARSLKGPTVPGASRNRAGNYIPKDQRTSRKAHPGNWADVTSHLASSIQSHIKKNGYSINIVVEATAEYAAALDAKTGYDVLGGADSLARNFIKQHEHLLFR